jgi:hypothetical protein
MRAAWPHAFLLALTTLLAGCLEVDQQCTINPDGSARIRVRFTADLDKLKALPSAEHLDPEDARREARQSLHELARQCLETAEGVDAWTEYAYDESTPHRITLSLTAYTRDFTRFALKPENGEVPNMRFHLQTPDESGLQRWVMTLPGVNDALPTPSIPRLEASEVADIIRERRRQFQEEAPESRPLFHALEVSSTLRFSGTVKSTQNAQPLSRREARIIFRGSRFYTWTEEVLADRPRATQAYQNGAELFSRVAIPAHEINAALFSESAPVSIDVLPGSRQLFDFEEELARARANPARIRSP